MAEASNRVQGTSYEVLTLPTRRDVIKTRCFDLVEAAKGYNALVFLDKGARDLSFLYGLVARGLNEPVPARSFINSGKEKGDILEFYCAKAGIPYGELSDTEKVRLINEGQILTDKIALERVYGTENIARLEHVLRSSGTGHKLVVDEKQATGLTEALTRRILSLVDPESEYDFFVFAPVATKDTPKRTRILYKDVGDIFWDERSGSLVSDYPDGIYSLERDKSFVTVPNSSDAGGVSLNRNFREELRRLAGEIIQEGRSSINS